MPNDYKRRVDNWTAYIIDELITSGFKGVRSAIGLLLADCARREEAARLARKRPAKKGART